jgi:lysophospholipase L1-like esterase
MGTINPLKGKSILIMGDSHVDGTPMGITLEKMLTESGASVKRFGWGGSAARTWLAGKKARGKQFTVQQVKDGGPYDIAIISLGTNDAANAGVGTQDPAKLTAEAVKAVGQIKQIADTVGAKDTWWVEPPLMKDTVKHYTNFNVNFVRQEGRKVFGERAIDATSVGTPDSDGVHLYSVGGKAWAKVVHDRVMAGTTSLGLSTPLLWGGGLFLAVALGFAVVKLRQRA